VEPIAVLPVALLIAAALLLPSWALLAVALVAIRDLPVPGFDATVMEPLRPADLLLMIWIIRHAVTARSGERLRLPSSALLLAAFFVWSAATSLVHGAEITPLLRIALYAGIFAVLAARPARGELYPAIVGYAVVEVVVSFPQWGTRLIGVVTNDPQQLGMVVLAALALVLARRGHGALRPVLLALLAAAVVFGRTRGIWFAAAVLFALWLQPRLSRRRLLVLIAVLLAVAFVLLDPLTSALGLNPESGQLRAMSISSGLDAVAQSPWIGHGWAPASDPAADPTETPAGPVYNLYVQLAVSTGLLGLGLWLAFQLRVLRSAARKDRAAFLYLGAFSALSLTEATVYAGSLVTVLLFIFAGSAESAAAAARSHESASRT